MGEASRSPSRLHGEAGTSSSYQGKRAFERSCRRRRAGSLSRIAATCRPTMTPRWSRAPFWKEAYVYRRTANTKTWCRRHSGGRWLRHGRANRLYHAGLHGGLHQDPHRLWQRSMGVQVRPLLKKRLHLLGVPLQEGGDRVLLVGEVLVEGADRDPATLATRLVLALSCIPR